MKQRPSGEVRELAAKWRQWTEVVGLFAKRQDERFSVSAEEYGALYAELSRLCRERAGHAVQAESDVFSQCREILAPWVTLDALHWTEREIIRDLWDRCRQTERMLGGRPAEARSTKGSRAWLAAGVLAVAAFLAAVWFGSRRPDFSPLEAIQRWMRLAERAVTSAGPEQTAVLGGAVVALVVGVVVWRSARGW